jgi:hypothetical protein
MTKEERVKLVFETISKIAGFEIEPDKEFYIVANGKRVRYVIDKFLNLLLKNPNDYFGKSDYNILPILKGGYQLEEIKEPLLTEEGRNFLRQFKFEKLLIKGFLYLHDKNNAFVASIGLDSINLSFDGLERGKKYSSAELGL